MSNRHAAQRKESGECLGVSPTSGASPSPSNIVPYYGNRATPETIRLQVFARYVKGDKLKDIARDFDIAESTVSQIARRHGALVRPTGTPSTKVTDNEWAKLDVQYLNGASLTETARKFRVGEPRLKKHLVLKNITARDRLTAVRNKLWLPPDETAFDKITPESAYWAGYLMADGCVSTVGRFTPRICLISKLSDEAHMDKFIAFLRTKRKKHYPKNPGLSPTGYRYGPTCGVQVTSRRMADALAKYGVTPGKTGRECVKLLEFNRDFWRGVIDGDGTIGRMSSRSRIGQPNIALVGSVNLTTQFCEFMRHLGSATIVMPKKRGPIYHVGFSYVNARMIIKALYENCSVALDRKNKVAQAIIEDSKTYRYNGQRFKGQC
jgi:transposase-like protein